VVKCIIDCVHCISLLTKKISTTYMVPNILADMVNDESAECVRECGVVHVRLRMWCWTGPSVCVCVIRGMRVAVGLLGPYARRGRKS